MASDRKADNVGGASPLTPEFGKYVEELLEEFHVPATSVAVIDGDNIYTAGYGHATLPDKKATPETVYFGGSTTKSMTAALLAHLIDTKEYPQLAKGWRTTISSILREDFVLQDEYATQHATLEDAAMHRTGFATHGYALMAEKDGKYATTLDHVRAMRHLQMGSELRQEFQYSNHGYMTLSIVIERVTGKPLKQLFREKLWGPLGMKSTYFGEDELEGIPEDVATSYRWGEKSQKYESVPRDKIKLASGAGSAISTVIDYAKWIKFLIDEAEPFSKAAHKDIQKPGNVARPGPNKFTDIVSYGFAQTRRVYRGNLVLGHNGGCSQGAETYWLPNLKWGFITMGNTSVSSNLVGMVLFHKLLDDKLKIPEDDRLDLRKQYKPESEDKTEDKITDELYPSRSKPGLPSPVDIATLAGVYHDEGYGTMDFVVKAQDGKEVLVAERPDLWVEVDVIARHVSGQHWAVQLAQRGPEGGDEDNFRASFEIGVDGKPKSFTLDFGKNGIVVFARKDCEQEGAER